MSTRPLIRTDIASMIRDYREFDRAVGLAYEFYRKYPQETLDSRDFGS